MSDEFDETPKAGETRRKQQQAEKRASRIVKEDLHNLAQSAHFQRWIGRLIQRCGLTDDLQTTNGGDIQRFMGRRSISVEVLAELDRISPGFYERVLKARRAFEEELRATNPQENTDGD